MDQILKQRLVGAVILVSLAVIFIPVILEGPDDELIPRFQVLPETPVVDYNTSVDLPLPAPALDDEDAQEPQAVPDDDVQAQVDGKQQQVAAAGSDSTAAPQSREPPAGWYVQVGSFSQSANASALKDSLSSSGLSVYVQSVAAAGKQSYRVLVGPEDNRAGAERQQARLAGKLGLQGLVVELDER